MSRKVFVDSDIIIDLLARREQFYHDAAKLFTSAYMKKTELYTTALVLANVFYIIRKLKGNEETKRQLMNLRLLVNILPINENVVDIALNSKFSDFEDGLQYYTAKENNLFAIMSLRRAEREPKVRCGILSVALFGSEARSIGSLLYRLV